MSKTPNDYRQRLQLVRQRDRAARLRAKLHEQNALFRAGIVAGNVEPDRWESQDSPRVSKKNTEKNKEFIDKLDVTGVTSASREEVYVDHMDPQYKRQISMVINPENVIPEKEPGYLDGRGDHRISKLGYAKIADRQGDLKTDVYLYPYDPNWKRSEEMVQQAVKHQIANHGNSKRIMPEPDSTMFVSIKEAWDELVSDVLEED